MSAKCDLLLIDGFSLLYRAYYGYPPNLTTPEGVPINAVYGFITMMLNTLKQFNPTHVGICLDRKEPTYRHELFPEYKANRSAPDDDFLVQLPEFKRLLSSFDIPLLELAGYESDDLLGTLSNQFSNQGKLTYILSSDMDLLQLINANTSIVMSKKGVSNYVVYDTHELTKNFNLTTDQFIDYKALKGDPSDNIPGVKGVGEKTALALLGAHHTLDGIYDQLAYIASASVRKKLETNKDMAYLSKTLVTINQQVPIQVKWDDFLFQPDWFKVHDLFETYQFKRLMSRLNDFSAEPLTSSNTDQRKDISVSSPPVIAYEPASFQIIDTVADAMALMPLLTHGFAFDLETTSLDPRDAHIVAVAITASKGISFVLYCSNNMFSGRLLDDEKPLHPLMKVLKPLLEDASIPKIAHNAKYEYQVLSTVGIQLNGVSFDTMLAAHLLDYSAIGLKALAVTCLNVTMTDFDAMMGDHDNIEDVSPLELARYAAEDSHVTYLLYDQFNTALTGDLRTLFQDIEIPLLRSLSEMELNGVQCDIQYLTGLSKQYHDRLMALEQAIYELAGRSDFNINSTQQLAKVLFDDLGLPVIKKTKTARSTDSSVLEKLARTSSIAREILQYRMYKKLVSTYVDRLPELVHPMTQKIHTSFNQAVTATGRLSSNHPNLQNIPVRSPEGQKIRCAFMSRFKDGRILSVDYSQIELRVLAHLANDPAMIQAFKAGHDIHQSTAAKIFGVAYDNVTKIQRDQAKTVNFGITYGQSAFALADQLGISRAEAKDIIDAYYAEFSRIRTFMGDVVRDARNNGYVTTLFGRQRRLTDFNNPKRSVQANAERISINTTVQGSAADIIKKAMVDMVPLFSSVQSKLILQVHDELVFDIFLKEYDMLVPKIIDIMVSTVSLSVPLVVDVESGASWGSLT